MEPSVASISESPEVLALRERVASLTASLVDRKSVTPHAWGLSPTEKTIFGMLLKRDEVTKDAILTVLYGNDGPSKSRVLDAFMAKLRRKTKSYGVKIRTIHDVGYALMKREAWVVALDPSSAN